MNRVDDGRTVPLGVDPASGAEAFRGDVPDACIELIDGGHFLLESHLEDVVRIIREWHGSL